MNILKPYEYVHIPEHSHYNSNYYYCIKTGDVILEEFSSSEDSADYYNLGPNPTYTNEDFKCGKFLGSSYSSIYFLGLSGDEEFEISPDFS